MRLLGAYRTPGQFRLIFEEFFFLECGLALKRAKSRAVVGIKFELNDGAREKIKQILPFKPTAAQKRVPRRDRERYGGADSDEPSAARRRRQRQGLSWQSRQRSLPSKTTTRSR